MVLSPGSLGVCLFAVAEEEQAGSCGAFLKIRKCKAKLCVLWWLAVDPAWGLAGGVKDMRAVVLPRDS